jgi:hypothetical protein
MYGMPTHHEAEIFRAGLKRAKRDSLRSNEARITETAQLDHVAQDVLLQDAQTIDIVTTPARFPHFAGRLAAHLRQNHTARLRVIFCGVSERGFEGVPMSILPEVNAGRVSFHGFPNVMGSTLMIFNRVHSWIGDNATASARGNSVTFNDAASPSSVVALVERHIVPHMRPLCWI